MAVHAGDQYDETLATFGRVADLAAGRSTCEREGTSFVCRSPHADDVVAALHHADAMAGLADAVQSSVDTVGFVAKALGKAVVGEVVETVHSVFSAVNGVKLMFNPASTLEQRVDGFTTVFKEVVTNMPWAKAAKWILKAPVFDKVRPAIEKKAAELTQPIKTAWNELWDGNKGLADAIKDVSVSWL